MGGFGPAEEPGAKGPGVRTRFRDLQARAEKARVQLEGRYGDRRAVSVVRDVMLLDRAVAGSELAGALAYRVFLWFLPFVLVVVAGLGVYADASDQAPREVADRIGLAGLVVHSVSAAASSGARWYALLIGIPVLLYVTRSLLRSVVAVYRLAWGLEPRRGQLTPANILWFLAAVVLSFALAGVVAASVEASAWFWLVVAPLSVVARGVVWLAISRRFPARDTRWTTLLPGALVVGFGLLGVNFFTQILIVWIGNTREDTYGTLGLAATILFSLWLTSRVIVLSAVADAALWFRAQGDPPTGPETRG